MNDTTRKMNFIYKINFYPLLSGFAVHLHYSFTSYLIKFFTRVADLLCATLHDVINNLQAALLVDTVEAAKVFFSSGFVRGWCHVDFWWKFVHLWNIIKLQNFFLRIYKKLCATMIICFIILAHNFLDSIIIKAMQFFLKITSLKKSPPLSRYIEHFFAVSCEGFFLQRWRRLSWYVFVCRWHYKLSHMAQVISFISTNWVMKVSFPDLQSLLFCLAFLRSGSMWRCEGEEWERFWDKQLKFCCFVVTPPASE